MGKRAAGPFFLRLFIRKWRQKLRRFGSFETRNRSGAKKGEDLTANPVGSRAKGLELDLHLREFEINQLTQRNNFFMIFQGVLIAGIVQSQGTAAPIITFGISLLGMATSVFQIGMAGGSKYWQSRWEASTRSSEIAIVLQLVKEGKLAVQTFTHDSALLTSDEIRQIADWNTAQSNDEEKIIDMADHIRMIVMADVNAGRKKPVRGRLDWWVSKWAIEPKWSVSRIPIWMGGSLLLFWFVIALHSVHIPRFKAVPAWWTVSLQPLKAEPAPMEDKERKRLVE